MAKNTTEWKNEGEREKKFAKIMTS